MVRDTKINQMTTEQIRAQLTVEDLCNGDTPEETIELCKSVISEAERIQGLAEEAIAEGEISGMHLDEGIED